MIHVKKIKKIIVRVVMFCFLACTVVINAEETNIISTRFSIDELEKLGASTLAESLDMVTAISNKKQSSKASILYQGVDLTNQAFLDNNEVLKNISLTDIDFIEISQDGSNVKYHLSKSLTKDGITALFSFTLLDLSNVPSPLDPVVSTATKSPKKVAEIGDVVRVVTGDELQTLGINTVEGALELFGNISITNASGIKSLFMRGQHSGSTKVLYNGIDLKDVTGTNGAPLFELIPIEDVQRIEVISGSKSTLYGSGALAGVINVITNTHTNNNYLQTTFSNNQNFNTTVKAVKDIANSQFYVIGNQETNNSISAKSDNEEIDSFIEESLTLGFFHQDNIPGSIQGMVSFVNQDQDLDGWWNTVEFNSSLVKFNYTLPVLSKSILRFNIMDTYSKREYSDGSVYSGSNNLIDINNTFSLTKGKSLLLGIDIQNETGKTPWMTKISQDNIAAYTQFIWDNTLLSSQIGARIEQSSFLGSDNVQTYNAAFFRQIPVLNARGTYTIKTGFRVPSLYEQSNAAETLAEETSKTHEFSLAKKFNKFVVKGTYFDVYLNNKISYDSGNYLNINKSTQKGMEYSVDFGSIGILKFLNLSYSDIQAKDNDTNALRIPDYKATLSAGINYKKWTYGLFIITEGNKPDSSGTIPAYAYADITTQYKLNSKTKLMAKCHNIFNKQYETAIGFNELGRTFFVGVKYTL